MIEVARLGAGKAAAPAGDPPAPPQTPPELRVVEWMAAAHDRPFSPAGVAAGLPAGFDGSDPVMLSRALARVGLKSRLVQRDPARLDPLVLPALLFPRGGGAPAVLRAYPEGGRRAVLGDPAGGGPEIELTARQLRRAYRRQALLVTPEADAALGRMSPAARAAPAGGHWFWGPVGANWSAWAQIILAAFIINSLSLALPLFVMNVYDRVIPNLAYVTLGTLAAGVALAVLLDLLIRTVRGNVLERIGRRVDLKVAGRLFEQAMDLRLLDRPGGAAGIASTIRDFEVVREFFASATFVALIDLAFVGIFVAVLFLIVGPLAFVPLAAIPVVMILALAAQVPIGRSAAQAQAMATKRHGILVEALSGIETIKSLNAEPVMQREWERAVAAASRINGRTRFWSTVATNGTLSVQQAVSIAIVVWGVFLVAEGRITIGGLIAANILAGRILGPLAAIAQTVFRAQYAVKSLGALSRFMAQPGERGGAVRSDARIRRGSVRLDEVGFTYPDAPAPALRDISLQIEPGEVVALLGRVGSGKTTLGKILGGLIVPTSGTVLVDGIALAQYEPAELRAGIGYLPQEPDLFTGTIRENLVIGRPSARDDEIQTALHHAGMDEFVASVPQGLDFFIGERGQRLSGGQRQGLALARLLLRRPRLLFLDEPTNAMDQRMETLVTDRLRALGRDSGTGLILCTHRNSLAAIADRFVVMDRGRIVLDGAPSDVMGRLREAQAGG